MAEQNASPGKVEKAWGEFMGWVDERFPLTETFEYHMSKYYAPKNFNFWYYFGVQAGCRAGLCLRRVHHA